MADTKISALTELTSVAPGDWVPVVDTSAAATKKYNTHYTYTGTSGSELQTLLAAANTAGGGIVECPLTNTITSTTKITIPEGVALRGNPGLTLTSTSDINMVEVAFNARLEGGGMTISNTNAAYSGSLVLLDSSSQNFEFKGNVTYVGNVLLKGHANNPTTGSIGLHLYAEAATGYTNRAIQACLFENIAYEKLNIAIREEVFGDTGAVVCYVNGNIHSGIVIDDCKRGIVNTETGAGALYTDGNIHENIVVEASVDMTDVINIVGDRNYYKGIVFDFTGGTPYIYSSGAIVGNYFHFPGMAEGNLDLTAGVDVPISYAVPWIMPRASFGNLPDVADYKFGQIFLITPKLPAICVSTGAVWSSNLCVTQSYNSPTSTELTSTHAKTLSDDELGPGVGWSSSGADAAFTFTLPAAVPGAEVLLAGVTQQTDITPNGSNVFDDNAGSGAANAMLGISSNQSLRFPAFTSFAHLKCYVGGAWNIVASRGTLSYVTP